MTTFPDPLELFLKAARENPDRPAVVSGEKTIRYAEMANRTGRLARAVRSAAPLGAQVAISLPKGAWAYAAMFGTLMAGGVYTPLNLEHPVEKQNRMLSLFKPNIIIATDSAGIAGLALPANCIVVTIDTLPAESAPLAPEQPHELAYVMFTSGSTGQPKGVMISRVALAHYTAWAHKTMKITPEDRWSQHPNIAFDLSVLDIFGGLCAGACLFPVVTQKDRLLPADFIRRHRLTIWNSVPSVIDLMAKARQLTSERLLSLRLATFCGEPLLRQHLDSLFTARKDLLINNTYGPTEATVSMTHVALTVENYRDKCASSVALGEPIPGMHILLEGGDSPIEGEAIIAGPQVARGYWESPEITDLAFSKRTIGGKVLPAYRTGDWVRREGNDLYFVARIDRQIKRHGYRLELGEIDSACRDAGAAAACTVFFDEQLVTFVEGMEESLKPALQQHLATVLPNYAIPTEIRSLPTLPRTANDKINALALEEMLWQAR